MVVLLWVPAEWQNPEEDWHTHMHMGEGSSRALQGPGIGGRGFTEGSKDGGWVRGLGDHSLEARLRVMKADSGRGKTRGERQQVSGEGTTERETKARRSAWEWCWLLLGLGLRARSGENSLVVVQ